MPPKSDPYRSLLKVEYAGARPDHYQLLGLKKFESNSDAIENAVSARVDLLQDLSSGTRMQEAQKLLNEVAQARLCLMNSNRKLKYDELLRANGLQPAAKNEHESGTRKPQQSLETERLGPKQNKPRESAHPIVIAFGVCGFLILAVLLGGWQILRNSDVDSDSGDPKSQSLAKAQADPVQKATLESSEIANQSVPDPPTSDTWEFKMSPLLEDFESESFASNIANRQIESPIGTWFFANDVATANFKELKHMWLFGIGAERSVKLRLSKSIILPANIGISTERWTFRSETIKDFFVVEVSVDGENWLAIRPTTEQKILTRQQTKGRPVGCNLSYRIESESVRWLRLTCNGQKNAPMNKTGMFIGEIEITSQQHQNN